MTTYSEGEKFPLTKEGISNLERELKRLIEVKKDDIKEQLSRAAEAGDERENDGFYLAFEDFKITKERIFWIKYVLKNVMIIDPQQNERIELGHRVVLEDSNGNEKTFQLVGDLEANSMKNMITIKSSLGSLLVGKRVGDSVKTEGIRSQKYLVRRIFT